MHTFNLVLPEGKGFHFGSIPWLKPWNFLGQILWGHQFYTFCIKLTDYVWMALYRLLLLRIQWCRTGSPFLPRFQPRALWHFKTHSYLVHLPKSFHFFCFCFLPTCWPRPGAWISTSLHILRHSLFASSVSIQKLPTIFSLSWCPEGICAAVVSSAPPIIANRVLCCLFTR